MLRVKNLGGHDQEVLLDGALLDAPPGTTMFTGPGGSLLELQNLPDGTWTLLVDNATVEPYYPDAGPDSGGTVSWWKFSMTGLGTHHVRVKNIGTNVQEITMDGAPLDAPPGTMQFTGPGGTLLELQRNSAEWVLIVDGCLVNQVNPHVDHTRPPMVWAFTLPDMGVHDLRAFNIGQRGQEVFLDGEQVPAPPGSTTFTGPGGTFLELQQRGTEWALLVDGSEIPLSDSAADTPMEAAWNFLSPHTGASHHLRVNNIGRKGQEVFIDGSFIPGPDGQRAFTGPGGTLLEIKQIGSNWALYADGLGIEDYNARSSTLTGASEGGALAAKRVPVTPEAGLPQGVSFEADTGVYKANIRVQGKFRCLGEFSTPDEAHARYLEAKKELG